MVRGGNRYSRGPSPPSALRLGLLSLVGVNTGVIAGTRTVAERHDPTTRGTVTAEVNVRGQRHHQRLQPPDHHVVALGQSGVVVVIIEHDDVRPDLQVGLQDTGQIDADIDAAGRLREVHTGEQLGQERFDAIHLQQFHIQHVSPG